MGNAVLSYELRFASFFVSIFCLLLMIAMVFHAFFVFNPSLYMIANGAKSFNLIPWFSHLVFLFSRPYYRILSQLLGRNSFLSFLAANASSSHHALSNILSGCPTILQARNSTSRLLF